MSRIAFRCDASILIGSGHVMRCLTLANVLREQGADITFVCREHPGHLFDLIGSSGYRLLSLPFDTVKSAESQASMLGATQAEDAKQTIAALETIGVVDWLIADHYALDWEWEKALRSSTRHILVIDDCADRAHDCDVLLDQNLHLSDIGSRYDVLVPPHCTKLLGPRFALLRNEFSRVREDLAVRDGDVKRILVFFGGSDPSNETGKALLALQQLGRSDIAIDVVVGTSNPNQEAIAGQCESIPNATIHLQVNNIAELMARADLAIGAGGGAILERCCTGLPAIVMSIADNQLAGSRAVARQGACLYLGEARAVSPERLANSIRVISETPDLLYAMSTKGCDLVDGKGVARVARQFVSHEIVLRNAMPEDRESVFDWRNAEESRKYSMDTAQITYQDHLKWYNDTLQNPARQLLIGELDGKPVGVVRFDQQAEKAYISIYMVPGNYGKGWGRHLIDLGVDWVRENWHKVMSVEALIKDENAASIQVFTDAGFRRHSCHYAKSIRANI